MRRTYAAALNCIDGRTQIPVITWMKENLHVHYVDLITDPGMDRVLSHDHRDEMNRLRENVIISIQAHGTRIVAVVGHHDCAANPVSDRRHMEDIKESVETVKSWKLPIRVIGLFVDGASNVRLVVE